MSNQNNQILSTARVRQLIHRVLPTDADLNAFLADYFPEDYRRVSGLQNREEKVTILLSLHMDELSLVVERLRAKDEVRVTRYGADLLTADSSKEEPSVDPVLTQLVFGHCQRTLVCDRYVQWTDMDSIARHPSHQVVLLPGERNQGHEYFLLRVQMALTRQPPRRIIPIWWKQQPFPLIAKDFLAALADGLHCDERELGSVLSIHLSQRNLVLLHRSVYQGFDDDALVRYYTDTLPGLLQDIKAPYFLKVIQPIEWVRSNGLLRLLARLRARTSTDPPQWVADALSHSGALRLLAEIKRRQRNPLTIYQMEDLQDITREHILKFCELIGFPRGRSANLAMQDREKLADRVLRGASTSAEILRQLARYLPSNEEDSVTRSVSS